VKTAKFVQIFDRFETFKYSLAKLLKTKDWNFEDKKVRIELAKEIEYFFLTLSYILSEQLFSTQIFAGDAENVEEYHEEDKKISTKIAKCDSIFDKRELLEQLKEREYEREQRKICQCCPFMDHYLSRQDFEEICEFVVHHDFLAKNLKIRKIVGKVYEKFADYGNLFKSFSLVLAKHFKM
jgi:hypothetical protein